MLDLANRDKTGVTVNVTKRPPQSHVYIKPSKKNMCLKVETTLVQKRNNQCYRKGKVLREISHIFSTIRIPWIAAFLAGIGTMEGRGGDLVFLTLKKNEKSS